MKLTTRLANDLAALGDALEDVATKMLEAGCFGIPCSFVDCPLSNWLRRGVLAQCVFRVCDAGPKKAKIEFHLPGSPLGWSVYAVPLPTAVRRFAGLFDRGRYKFLEKST